MKNKNRLILLLLAPMILACMQPVAPISVLQRIQPQRYLHLPKHTTKILVTLHSGFLAEKVVPASLSLDKFMKLVTPGTGFSRSKVQEYLETIQPKLTDHKYKEKERLVHELYYRLFIDYLIVKQIPTDSKSLLLHTTDEIYSFTTDKRSYPLRGSLTQMVLDIFNTNREQQTLRIFEVAKEKRRKLYYLLTDFKQKVKEQLTTHAEGGNFQAQQIIKKLDRYVIALQEHGLSLSIWGMVRGKAKAAGGLLFTAAAAYIIYNYLRVKPLEKMTQTVEKLAPQIEKTLKDVQEFKEYTEKKIDSLERDIHKTTADISKVATLTSELLVTGQEQAQKTTTESFTIPVIEALATKIGESEELRQLTLDVIGKIYDKNLQHEVAIEQLYSELGIQKNLTPVQADQSLRKQFTVLKSLGLANKVGWVFSAKVANKLLIEQTTLTAEERIQARALYARAELINRWFKLNEKYIGKNFIKRLGTPLNNSLESAMKRLNDAGIQLSFKDLLAAKKLLDGAEAVLQRAE